jgi:hypothetical protein
MCYMAQGAVTIQQQTHCCMCWHTCHRQQACKQPLCITGVCDQPPLI